MGKFLVKWKEVTEFEAEIEAETSDEAIDKAYEHDYDYDGDVKGTEFDEDSVDVRIIS